MRFQSMQFIQNQVMFQWHQSRVVGGKFIGLCL